MKKTLFKVLTLALVSVMLVCVLASCGSAYSKIEANLEDAGYKVVESDDTTNSITASLEDADITVTAHLFQKTEGDLVPVTYSCIVLEFGAEGDIDKALESDTLKGLISDAQKSEIVRDNCVLIPLSLIKYEEMKTAFNK